MPYSNKLCSRVWDIWSYAQTVNESNILFNDSDIFWFKDVEQSLNKLNGFYCNGNTGVFYFDKHLKKTIDVFKYWKFIISNVLIGDGEFYDEVSNSAIKFGKEFVLFQDEIALAHLLNQKLAHVFPSDAYMNFAPYYFNKNYNFNKISCFHALSYFFPKNKGLICLVFNELKAKIQKTLSQNQIDEIFGGHHIEKTFNFFDIKNVKEIENIGKNIW